MQQEKIINDITENQIQTIKVDQAKSDISPWMLVLFLIIFSPLGWYFMWKNRKFHCWFAYLFFLTGIFMICVDIFLLLFTVPKLSALYQEFTAVQPNNILTWGFLFFSIGYALFLFIMGWMVLNQVKKNGQLNRRWLIWCIFLLILNYFNVGSIQAFLISSILTPLYSLTSQL